MKQFARERITLITFVIAFVCCEGLGADFQKEIRPLIKEYCLACHSTEKHKGDLDLERFSSLDQVLKQPKIWQGVVEQISLGEMPPKDKPQPPPPQREALMTWANGVLNQIAIARAGDPGPVVLRRLSNAEYTYTIRDLTSVAFLEPAKEFPADSASGEGFMNVGNSLVMSPALLTKYLDAAKDIAAHAVLLPDGIAFSPSTSQRDWSEERLTAIRDFYARFTVNGGGSSVNLQGIKFDTKDGGVLPLKRYLEATLQMRDRALSLEDAVRTENLNPKYLGTLWRALNDKSPPGVGSGHTRSPSLLLDHLRAQWYATKPGETDGLMDMIGAWQQALWRFTTVGHIGKRDGPKGWQVPVTPIAEAREVRLKLPAPTDGKDVTVFLAASDVGDGNVGDFAVWENPRLVAPGRPDLPLRYVRAAIASLTAHREKVFSSASNCLVAATEVSGLLNKDAIARLAKKYDVEPRVLSAWLDCLGLGAGETRIDSYITKKTESAQGYDFIKGWAGADALSVIANSSDQHVRVPGNMKPHGVAVHPSPKLRVIVGWRSPVATTLRVHGAVQHAHPECGNGVTWALELRRGSTRQRLAAGTAQGTKEVQFGPLENVSVQIGDLLSLVIGPRDGNHSCDLTAVDLELGDGARAWSLAKDISANILAGNPHADSLGNAAVWHFYSEPDKGVAEPVLPTGSLLAKWQSSGNSDEKRRIGQELQDLLLKRTNQPKDGPDAVLYRQLTSLNGPLLNPILRSGSDVAIASDTSATAKWGLDPALFGTHPEGALVNLTSLCVRAPSVLEVRLPADLAGGCELVATATLHKQTGAEGSVQMQVLTTKLEAFGLTAGNVSTQGTKSTWSDGERPVVSDIPILVLDASVARKRIEAAFEDFRHLFPAALCYTKIVPVDEVVTLTLYYREDDHLQRLMLDDSQTAELNRLWAELHYVSQDALKLVDAFDQLWQYATQDADPSAFEPLREPIKRRAEEHKALIKRTQPRHLDAVMNLAANAWRRPLTEGETEELRGLYDKLRADDLSHDQAIRLTLARVLVAPAFLYRGEAPVPGTKASPVNDWELATRLSYFLWSSLPDAELRGIAASGKLHEPHVLVGQTRRMLRDSRVRRLATEFACAWLHIYEFDQLSEKSERHFPTFNALRGPMYEETIRFFTDLFHRDGSVLDILDADYTFLNADLARHYGITRVKFAGSNDWQRVVGVKKFGRGGILAQATTLAKQSGASRTSPILRGNWLTEVLLGDKLPRPPKDVPQLPEDEAAETLTVRELTQKHSSDPKCYGCHRRIDGYGYSLEAFDAIGRFRDRDLGGRPIDVKTQVMDGSEIDGLDGLRQYLLTRQRDAFLKQFCRKLLGYALGRGVLLSDTPLISEMRERLTTNDYRITAAIESIVRSKQFRESRGKDMVSED